MREGINSPNGSGHLSSSAPEARRIETTMAACHNSSLEPQQQILVIQPLNEDRWSGTDKLSMLRITFESRLTQGIQLALVPDFTFICLDTALSHDQTLRIIECLRSYRPSDLGICILASSPQHLTKEILDASNIAAARPLDLISLLRSINGSTRENPRHGIANDQKGDSPKLIPPLLATI